MKREIKFKAKRVNGKGWVYGFPFKNADNNYYVQPRIGTRVAVIPETVCQYTGLKDKNGVEIYEHDMVLTTKFAGKYNYYDSTGVVIYFGGGYQVKAKKGGGYKSLYSSIEITGNMHDKT